MAGRPRGAEARNAEIKIRMTETGKALAVKAARPLSLSDYVRGLIAADIRKKGL